MSESYFRATPSLREVASRRHYPKGSEQALLWRARTMAALEFAAMARELYGDRTMVFIARDGLPLYWVLDYLVAKEASPPSMKVVAFSGKATTDHPLLRAYFQSQGLAPLDFDVRGPALLDFAYGTGRTFRRFRELVGPDAVGHVMASTQPSVPPLRAALRHLDPDAGSMTGAEHIKVGHTHWEFTDIAYPTETMTGYVEHDGRIEAVAPASSPELQRESLRWKQHVRHLLGGRAKRFYVRRRSLWSAVRRLADSRDAEAYLEQALAQYKRGRSDGEAEALARDIVHVGLTNFPALGRQIEGRIGPAGVEELWRVVEGRDSLQPTLSACARPPPARSYPVTSTTPVFRRGRIAGIARWRPRGRPEE